MRLPRILLQFFLITLMAGCSGQAMAGLSVEASLSHLAFAVDQRAMLSITVTGSGRSAAIELPEIEGITFTARGQASQMSMINGAISSSSTSNYLIEAEKPGVYTLPPIKVKVGGDSAMTKPMSFEVTPAAGSGAGSGGSGGTAVSPGSSQAGEEAGFIRVSPTGDHYPGEIVAVTIKAYFNEKYRTDISSLVTMSGDGVVMPQLREKPEQSRENVGGRSYNVLSWQTTLTGIKEGRHLLGFALEASLLVPRKRSSRSPFGGGMFDDPMFNDPFFDSFFGGYQRRPVTVTSPPVVFNVVPLPASGQPADFSGAIGEFDLQVAANSREVEVGEPLTLTVAISGQGNFDRVEAPAFPDGPDWKTYSPAVSFTANRADHGTGGTKRFEQAIVPRSPAVREIPGLSFSYFDPAGRRYVTRTSSPIPVKVMGSAAPASPPAPTTTAAVPPAQAAKASQPPPPAATAQATGELAGLAPIHLQAGTFEPRLVPLWRQAWFLALGGLCLIVLLALLIRGILQHNRQLHPERERARQRQTALRQALQHLEQAQARGDGAAFFALCRSTIQDHLGRRWQTEPSAISLADLRARLAPDSPLIEIFRAADAAAYGGAMPSRQTMRDHLDILSRELEELR